MAPAGQPLMRGRLALLPHGDRHVHHTAAKGEAEMQPPKLVSQTVATACLLSVLLLYPEFAHSKSRDDVQKAIHRAEDVLDDLDDDFKDGLKDTALGDSARHEHLTHRMEALEDSFDVLRKRFKEEATYQELRSLLEDALSSAFELDGVISQYHFSKDVERDWSEVRSNLNFLARHYRLSVVRSGPAERFVPGRSRSVERLNPLDRPLAPPQSLDTRSLQRSIQEAERISDSFADAFKASLEREPVAGAGHLVRQAEELEDALDRIQSRAQRNSDSAIRLLVDRALQVAFEINEAIMSYPFSSDILTHWAVLRSHLNVMARGYSLHTLPE